MSTLQEDELGYNESVSTEKYSAVTVEMRMAMSSSHFIA